MTRHAMTLVELLLALALLSALTVASVSWTTSTVRASALHGSRAVWEAGASHILDLIGGMLLLEDHQLRQNDRDRWRIATENGDLLLRARTVVVADGPTRVSTTARLSLRDRVLTIEYLDEADAVLSVRPLLGELSSFAAEFEELETREYVMTVRLTHQNGRVLSRVWRLTREDVR
ncbi:MAG: prepilin-type N-terminal cleavage/methylation domain-containing protein [Planctomycetota bacterium]|nr:MAG: prepilin-type N-terminal cleavage/methylation domain-containing protein [Planctomycetota bacterium]